MTHSFDSDYSKGSLIGEGKLSKVFLCTKADSTELYAVREVAYGKQSEAGASGSLLAAFQTEANILSRLSHKCLPKVIAVYNDSAEHIWYTVLELFDNGDLATMISQYKLAGVSIPEEKVLEIFGQLVDVLSYLHETYKADSSEIHQIIHRNLRPENILLKLSGLVGIGSFRLAEEQEVPRKHMSCLDPNPYAAPEVLAGGSYGHMSDSWALGCIIAEMCLQERLFEGNVATNPIGDRLPVNLTRLGYSKALETLVNALLQKDVSMRCSALDLRNNPFLIHAKQPVLCGS